MLRTVRTSSLFVLGALASCGRGAKTDTAEPAALLGVYTPQRIIVAPTIQVALSATDSLLREFGTAPAVGRHVDNELMSRLRERDVGSNWIWPADLVRAYERNRTYAADPYHLAVHPVLSARFIPGSKYGEPLSSQLRTMIALHEDGRLVLLPARLWIGGGRATLRIVLLDPRYAEAKWVGEIRSDSSGVHTRASITQIARRLADLFVAP